MPLNLREQTVLIVDDLREMRMSLRAILESLNVKQIVEAKSAEEAHVLLTKHRPDLVLCDYNLGDGKDGQQFFEEAKAERLLPAHSVWIMITAENTMNMVMGVVENNPDGYLVKPINKSVLQVRLERVVARKMIVKDIESALHNGEFEVALALCERQLEKYPGMRSDLLRLKTEALLRTGAIEVASEICAEVLNERDLTWASITLARARYLGGDLRQAKTLLTRLIENQPTALEGYEWLARIEREQGDGKAAQRILAQAIQVSPKSIRRQQRLGDLAHVNADYPTSEKAYRRAIQMGENSCFARPDDQAGVVEAVTQTKGAAAGLKALGDFTKRAGRRFEAVPHWRLGVVEARLLQETGQQEAATTAAARALEGYYVEQASVAPAATLDLIKVCFTCGQVEAAQTLADKVVRENHDRQEVIAATLAMFESLGMAAEGAALIENAQKAIVAVNNQGVTLAKAGDYAAALKLLTQASDELPGNLTVTLNVLQAVMLQVRAEGMSAQRRLLVTEYLSRAMRISPTGEKVLRLRQQFQSLLNQAAKPVAAGQAVG
jgi:CheY-like chemotaxis protein